MKGFILLGLLLLIPTSLTLSQESGSGKISGNMFGDYFYNVARDSNFSNLNNTALSGAKDLNGFDFRRIYFTYDYKISDDFKTRFRLEAQSYSSGGKNIFLTSVKDAYINWNGIFEGSSLILGIQPLPAFTVSESYWGYRSLEKTQLDLRKVVSSRDFGVSLKGKINSSGSLNYWVTYANGSSFGVETDKYKRAYAHIEVKPDNNWRFSVYGDYKFQSEIANPNMVGESLNHDAFTSALFAGYQEKDKFSVGAEGFLQMTSNDTFIPVINSVNIDDRNALGLSLFGWYKFCDRLIGIGRYDFFDPNMASGFRGDSRNFMLLGLSYILHEKVTLTPNIEFETYEPPVNGASIDPSLTARITFMYEFL